MGVILNRLPQEERNQAVDSPLWGLFLILDTDYANLISCFPVMGGLFQLDNPVKNQIKVVSPLWGLFQDTAMPSRVKAAESTKYSTNFGF